MPAQRSQMIRRHYEELSGQGAVPTHLLVPRRSAETPAWLRGLIQKVSPQVCEHSTGLGSVIPDAIAGCRVLELGCGAGRDSYVLSQLVGVEGEVIGVDVTPSLLDLARSHVDEQMDAFGFDEPNVRFLQGCAEDLGGLGIGTATVDVVVADGLLSLSASPMAVFHEVFRVLKPGGEFFFCDVFSDAPLPEELRSDERLTCTNIAGALTLPECFDMLRAAGCAAPCLVEMTPLLIDDPEVAELCEGHSFTMVTIRAFRAPLEGTEQDYNQRAVYLGTIPHHADAWRLDSAMTFPTGESIPVSGNMASMISSSRLARHFHVFGGYIGPVGPFSRFFSPDPASGNSLHQEHSTMMSTMQMPGMIGMSPMMGMPGMSMPGMSMSGMPMSGMPMSSMTGSAPMSSSCQTMMSCCQEMMNCCRMMSNMGEPSMACCQQMMGCCSKMMSCCQQMMMACQGMMMNPAMMPMCQQMMACCNNMMMCCNTLMMQCRMMMQGAGMDKMGGGMEGSSFSI